MDLTQFIAGGGIIGLFAASAVVLFRSMRYEGSVQQQMVRENTKLQVDLEDCQRKKNLLIASINQQGGKVPPEVWS